MKRVLSMLTIRPIEYKDGEIVSISIMDVINKDYQSGDQGHIQIGSDLPLSHNKTIHFSLIQKATGYQFYNMIFFDDDSWSANSKNARYSGLMGVPTQPPNYEYKDIFGRRMANDKLFPRGGLNKKIFDIGIALWISMKKQIAVKLEEGVITQEQLDNYQVSEDELIDLREGKGEVFYNNKIREKLEKIAEDVFWNYSWPKRLEDIGKSYATLLPSSTQAVTTQPVVEASTAVVSTVVLPETVKIQLVTPKRE